MVGKAQSTTDGMGALTVKGNFNLVKNPTGLSVAGARAFQANVSDVEISAANNANRLPNATEGVNVRTLLSLTNGFVSSIKGAGLQTEVNRLNGAANRGTTEDKANGNFVKIDKSKGLTAKATVVAGNGMTGNENASATAIQKVLGKSISTSGTTVSSSILAGTNVPSLPSVAGVAVNRDPISVTWTSASDHTATLDLTGTSFQASTTGLGSTALAASDFQVSYVDGATDPENTTQPSTPILDVALGAISTDGNAATSFGFLLSYTGGGMISDSMGGMGTTDVADDLASILTAMPNGTFAIVGPYSISFDTWGSASRGRAVRGQLQLWRGRRARASRGSAAGRGGRGAAGRAGPRSSSYAVTARRGGVTHNGGGRGIPLRTGQGRDERRAVGGLRLVELEPGAAAGDVVAGFVEGLGTLLVFHGPREVAALGQGRGQGCRGGTPPCRGSAPGRGSRRGRPACRRGASPSATWRAATSGRRGPRRSLGWRRSASVRSARAWVSSPLA